MPAKKKEFNIADHLKPEDVFKMNTAQTQILHIPLKDITGHERNFYELSGIDELMDSIALNGLIEPIIVMPCTDVGAKYKILSGHRRYSAVSRLAETEPEKYSSIAAILREPKNEIIAELLLIEANRATRKLSSADLMVQAERYVELLSKLKDTGVEIPGRMRDAVAAAMEVSASKLARLSAIKNNLYPEALEAFKANKLNESTAYTLSQAPTEVQVTIFENTKNLYEWRAKDLIRHHERISSIICTDGSPCSNRENMFLKDCKGNGYSIIHCTNGECCERCSELATCKVACPKLADKIKNLKDDEKQKRAEAKSAEEAYSLKRVEKYNRYWIREGIARKAAGVSHNDVNTALRNAGYYSFPIEYTLKQYENGNCEDSYVASFFVTAAPAQLIALAELYHCSVDYLLLRTDDPKGIEAAPSKTEQDPGSLCKSAHTFCDKCCSACDDPCNAWQTCRRDGDEVSPTGISIQPGPAWHPNSVEPNAGQEIIAVDAAGYAEDATFLRSGEISGGGMRWDEVILWTPFPTGVTAMPTVEPHAVGWVPLQFVNGMEKPPKSGKYYCRFDCDGAIIEQLAWWDDFEGTWSFKDGGAKIDAKCLGWFPLPEDDET